MSWIKENKFVAVLAGATACIAGGISYYAVYQGKAYESKLESYEELKSEYVNISKAKPYPNEQNLELREKAIKDYQSTIEEVSSKLASYRFENSESLSPGQFSDARVEMERNLREAFKGSGTTLPAGCSFGFEKYSSVQPKPEATRKLGFQLGAIESVLNMLAETKPSALLNIKRYELPVEKTGVPEATKKNTRPKNTQEELYQMMPVELGFTATEASIRDFLKKMVNSKDYFYSISSVRVKNEKQRSPAQKDVKFETASKSSNTSVSIGGFDFGDEIAQEEEVVVEEEMTEPGDQFLYQVLGEELLDFHITFNLVFIKANQDQKSN
ncbi:MAG: Amuc_1100 family pilus-like protein [Akkermansiaceae bacterium]